MYLRDKLIIGVIFFAIGIAIFYVLISLSMLGISMSNFYWLMGIVIAVLGAWVPLFGSEKVKGQVTGRVLAVRTVGGRLILFYVDYKGCIFTKLTAFTTKEGNQRGYFGLSSGDPVTINVLDSGVLLCDNPNY